MKEKVIAIFDVGKTNKKLLLFDYRLNLVMEQETRVAEIVDDDGFECHDIEKVEKWIRESILKLVHSEKYELTAINFATYGATIVYLDAQGKRIGPVYNYLRPIDEKIPERLYRRYGGQDEFCRRTASPALGMLNSGIQILWLKTEKPEVYDKVLESVADEMCMRPGLALRVHTGPGVLDGRRRGAEAAVGVDGQNGDAAGSVIGREDAFSFGIHREMTRLAAAGGVPVNQGEFTSLGINCERAHRAISFVLRLGRLPNGVEVAFIWMQGEKTGIPDVSGQFRRGQPARRRVESGNIDALALRAGVGAEKDELLPGPRRRQPEQKQRTGKAIVSHASKKHEPRRKASRSHGLRASGSARYDFTTFPLPPAKVRRYIPANGKPH
ncbi:MAG: FGGY family carbohydrate kinase [Verrucomicrobiota bacterium]